MKRILALFALWPLWLWAQDSSIQIIPQPQHLEQGNGRYTLHNATFSLRLDGSEASELADYISTSPLQLKRSRSEKADVRIFLDETGKNFESDEAYSLKADTTGIEISARHEAGLFYGFQTLLQLSRQPITLERVGCVLFPKEEGDFEVPYVNIDDAPRFKWRGMHMDVSRHFFSPRQIKKQLRMMARYKLNRFHWHLTDDSGWRLELKSYPQLTQTTAYRPVAHYMDWSEQGRRFCNKDTKGASGGCYTQAEVRDIIDYARRLHITVVPEIEMPGHSWEVLATFPELACSGKGYENSELCIGNDKTFTFVEKVLSEVMEIFPSEYIHIGGDEADRSHWAKCSKCQARMQREGLSDVRELQSYFTRRVEDFLARHGRKMVGWDEIIEGGLSPRATVMSWRGEEGGITAARTGHDAIMTPWVCYLDNAQDFPIYEPRGIGGYLPIRRCYDYDPVPAALTEQEARHILGVQANLWAEFIPTEAHQEYMYYPRLCAIAETAWTKPQAKNYERFRAKALGEVEWLKRQGYYPFELKYEYGDRIEAQHPIAHKAIGRPITYATPVSPKYPGSGDNTLVDGLRGGFTYQDGRWQGFESKDFDVTIDLGSVEDISHVEAEFIQRLDQWIWMPREVIVYGSEDGQNFTELGRQQNDVDPQIPGFQFRHYGWTGQARARYVRYVALQNGHPGGWIFTDEIVVQ